MWVGFIIHLYFSLVSSNSLCALVWAIKFFLEMNKLSTDYFVFSSMWADGKGDGSSLTQKNEEQFDSWSWKIVILLIAEN